jgi:hypothetical protein
MTCNAPLDWDTLLAYRLGELDAEREASVEEHYLGCAACSRRLEELHALADGVHKVARESGVTVHINNAFVHRLAANGQQVREYVIPWNGSVNCTITPDDDFVVSHLQVPLENVERVDLAHLDRDGKEEWREKDVPFIPDSGSVVVSTSIVAVRAMPAMTLHMRLLAVDGNNERTLGDYTLYHRPYTPD